jgi:hypothetical protein
VISVKCSCGSPGPPGSSGQLLGAAAAGITVNVASPAARQPRERGPLAAARADRPARQRLLGPQSGYVTGENFRVF